MAVTTDQAINSGTTRTNNAPPQSHATRELAPGRAINGTVNETERRDWDQQAQSTVSLGKATSDALNSVNAGLTTEAQVRASADTVETGARTSADAAEIVARINADTAEANTRAAADTAEAGARVAADTAEAGARIAADNAETASRIAANNAEAAARVAGDALAVKKRRFIASFWPSSTSADTAPDLTQETRLPYGSGGASSQWKLMSAVLRVEIPNTNATAVQLFYVAGPINAAFGGGVAAFQSPLSAAGSSVYEVSTGSFTGNLGATGLPSGSLIAPQFSALGGSVISLVTEWEEA